MPPSDLYQTLSNRFPFISVVRYGASQEEYVGIIQNADSVTTSMYDFGAIQTDEEKRLFLLLGERWYYESNRQLPINIFLKHEWDPFQNIFKTFITKELQVIHGPATSLSTLGYKKKRRSIMVVKKL